MLTFDIEKMRSIYVYILKVTTDYVYVTTTRSGAPYRVNSSVQDTYNGHTVSKIRIHRSVSHAYSKFYATREYANPRLASLNYYGDDVVSIEVQMINRWAGGYQDASNWQSFFSRVVPRLRDKVASAEEAWINGTEVFWFKKETDDKGNEINSTLNEFMLDKEGHLSVRAVEFVRLGSMGLSVLAALNNRKEVEASNTGDKETLEDIVNRANLRIEDGKVLTYYPNGNDEQAERIAVYSPVLQQKKLNDSYQSVSRTDYTPDEEKKVFHLTSESNPAYANIDFAIKAANTIGKLYGYEVVDDLDIPRVIAQTGQVNLMNIDEDSRRTTPIHMTALSCLAYVFRFIYRETELSKMRDLSNMFRFCINKGLVYQSEIDSDFRSDAPDTVIPLGRFQSEEESKKTLNDLFSQSA